eukprot:2472919-Alexandrium_andersonii.AAC.1
MGGHCRNWRLGTRASHTSRCRPLFLETQKGVTMSSGASVHSIIPLCASFSMKARYSLAELRSL